MSERSFRLHDTSLMISARSGQKARSGRHNLGWAAPDCETFNRVLAVLAQRGFDVTRDPRIEERYATLSKYHRIGRRLTPGGNLQFHAETTSIGCTIEFYQDLVTENRNGGRYDFDKRAKMPYLIGKAFEAALRALRGHLIERGFAEQVKIESPVPDPLAYFNERWDSEYERRRGVHRFARSSDGWPDDTQVRDYDRRDRDGNRIDHGDIRYFRTYAGQLMRGRAWGGINGMWIVTYGPGLRDYTQKASWELFTCDPLRVPRRVHPRSTKRLSDELKKAVEAEQFERAIVLRDVLRRTS